MAMIYHTSYMHNIYANIFTLTYCFVQTAVYYLHRWYNVKNMNHFSSQYNKSKVSGDSEYVKVCIVNRREKW